MSPTELHIGELARRTGYTVETIRYYERIGLLPKPRRASSRYRLFDQDDIARVMFIRRARDMGFTINEVRALLHLARDNGSACSRARDLAAEHLANVRAKISHMQALERALSETVRLCSEGDAPKCPLIEALSLDAPSETTAPVQGPPNACA